jgi:hypothetical protein
MESKAVADLRQIQRKFADLSNALDAHPGHITEEQRGTLAQLSVDLHWSIEAVGKHGL